MELSNDLISQFVEATKPEKTENKETTVYGTIVEYNGRKCVKLDGSEENVYTPISMTADALVGERVTVMIKDHSAIVTGNMSSPSARTDTVKDLGNDLGSKISEFEIVIADKVSTDRLEAEIARIDTLVSDNVTITGRLDANDADIRELTAENATINGKLTAVEASIEDLDVKKLDAEQADIKYATIENLEATNADIYNLEATYGEFKDLTTDKLAADDARITNLEVNKLDTESAKIMYANIDFANINIAAVKKLFSDSGIIKDLIVEGEKITGELVGVTIKGDLIEAGTLRADRLVVLGTDGNYYRLNYNFDGPDAVGIDPVKEDQIHGSNIVAKSITATKIAVDDLVAFNATIGGFNITNSAIHSGAKSSVDNTVRGIYLDKEGQLAIGDQNNFMKYYKADDGTYKLEISAGSIKMSSSNKTIEEAIDGIEIGGRNLIENTSMEEIDIGGYPDSGYNEGLTGSTINVPTENEYVLSFDAMSTATGDKIQCFFYNSNNNTIQSVVTSTGYNSPHPDGHAEIELTNSWKRYWVKYTQDGMSVTENKTWIVGRRCAGDGTGNISIRGIKLETGNKATDWTPAPEDTSEDIRDVRHELSSSFEQTAKGIVSTAIDSYDTVTDENGSPITDVNGSPISFKKEIFSQLDQTADNIKATFTEKINKVNNDVSDINSNQKDFENRLTTQIKFGINGVQIIDIDDAGKNRSSLKMGSGKIEFYQNYDEEYPVGSWDSKTGYFYSGNINIRVDESARFGNYAFIPRKDGSLMLVKVGG